MTHFFPFSLAVMTTLFVSACTHLREASPTGCYTTTMYRCALANENTATDFILITLTDARTGASRVVCTEAPFLEGALHKEFGIPYDEVGLRRVRRLALDQPDRHFCFSNPKALANITQYYTPDILDEVRALIKPKSDRELLNKSIVQTLYANRPQEQYNAYRDAIAHALLERGISCIRGCFVGDLTPYR